MTHESPHMLSAATPADDTRLGSVVVPCLKSDLPELRRIFRLWSDPRFTPLLSPDVPKPALLVVFNAADEALMQEARALYAEFPDLARSFSGIEVHSADLEGDRDLYARVAAASAGAYGNKAGPNFLFQAAMHRAAPHGGFTLQAELDCLPLGRDWIAGVDRLLATAAGDAWVIGAPYLGDVPLSRAVRFHVNGNALYRCGSPAFLEFLDEVWMESLVALSETLPNLAYDCWWALQMERSDAQQSNTAWRLWQRYGVFFLHNPFVVNLLAGPDDARAYLDLLKRLQGQSLRPLFLHGPAIPAVVDLLLTEPDLSAPRALEALHGARGGPSVTEAGPDRDIPVVDFLAKLAEAMPAHAGPRVLLGPGVHQLEGPNAARSPVRYAWTGDEKIMLFVLTPGRDLELVLRDGHNRDLRKSGLPEMRVTRQGTALPCEVEILEHPAFLRVRVPREAFPEDTALTLHTGQETFVEGGSGGRRMGMILFEIGARFGEMRFGFD